MDIAELADILLKANIAFLDHMSAIPNQCFRSLLINNIFIPKSIESISDCSFMDCSELKWVKLQFGKKLSLGNFVFSGCSSLETIFFDGTKEQWDKVSFSAYWNIGMPSEVSLLCNDGEYKLSKVYRTNKITI